MPSSIGKCCRRYCALDASIRLRRRWCEGRRPSVSPPRTGPDHSRRRAANGSSPARRAGPFRSARALARSACRYHIGDQSQHPPSVSSHAPCCLWRSSCSRRRCGGGGDGVDVADELTHRLDPGIRGLPVLDLMDGRPRYSRPLSQLSQLRQIQAGKPGPNVYRGRDVSAHEPYDTEIGMRRATEFDQVPEVRHRHDNKGHRCAIVHILLRHYQKRLTTHYRVR